MEIDITRFFETAATHDFSASAAELGQDAGEITWANAKREAREAPLLTTQEELDAIRGYMRESGGWDDEQVAAWPAEEVNALFIQWISGDKNEMEHVASDDNGDVDWTEVERLQEDGVIASNIYRGDDGKVYFCLGI